ncbi:hypothetical protein DL96DRAFT_1694798 [Flagelloscypha sp. PMI_526]|nr:hypothetical protein DL96DRAFT_1694798 [Flagelloscypha sp. PMI_526]
MSHGHSHAPGEDHNHSHGPSPPQQQQQAPLAGTDPAGQSLIDQDFKPVDIALGQESHIALCGPHKLERCKDCDIDYVPLNRMSRILAQNPNLRCFPPPNAVTNNLSTTVTSTKDEGNKLFKAGRHADAIKAYNTAAAICVQRPTWELQTTMRDELSAILSNRSAAYYESEDFISALADAEAVIQLKRPWSKGHFRKASALLGLYRLDEASNAMALGLAFDPQNQELGLFVKQIQKEQEKAALAKAKKAEEENVLKTA